MNPTIKALFSSGCLIIFGFGCATVDKTAGNLSTSQMDVSTVQSDSAVDISYGLGRSQYRMVLRAKDRQIKGQYSLDNELVKTSLLEPSKYLEFVKKAKAFADSEKRLPAQAAPCHSPFTVLIQVGSEQKTVTGCRSSDEGALSHLVKEGEFLLYSKK